VVKKTRTKTRRKKSGAEYIGCGCGCGCGEKSFPSFYEEGRERRYVGVQREMTVTARVGLLYRARGYILSIRVPEGETMADRLATMTRKEEVEEWMEERIRVKGTKGDHDPSYFDYFYRCLDEDVDFYYLYDETVGWRCGCTQRELPIRGRLVGLEDWLQWRAIEEV